LTFWPIRKGSSTFTKAVQHTAPREFQCRTPWCVATTSSPGRWS
jgi:hypothetical protein